MKKRKAAKKSGWNPDDWLHRCAWCAREIGEEEPVFGISVRLHPIAFQEFDPGTVQQLLLPSAGKTVPIMLASLDSPAKHEGKDAMCQICSDECGKALQEALRVELVNKDN
jgi:hypothetical protein